MAARPLHHVNSLTSDTVVGSPDYMHPAMQIPSRKPSRKAYPSIDIEDAAGIRPSPQSSTSNVSQEKGSPRVYQRLGRVSTARLQPKLSKSSSWTFEVVSLLVAVGAIIAMVALLAQYDNKPLPRWPHDITLNTMIALLATIANAALAVPLCNGLSQLKWNRFLSGRAPLADMELFDEASRGTWGALMLLVKFRGGILGSFGAIVAIIALALSPFAQQVATYEPRMVTSDSGATNFRSTGYKMALDSATSAEGFIPILPLKAAVYNGLFAEDEKPLLKLPVDCLTGNCTWSHFDTLGVCNQCVDMSDFMSRYCEDGEGEGNDMTQCGWQLPSGAKLNNSAEVFSMTSMFASSLGQMPFSTIMELTFMGTEAQDGLAGKLRPWARKCTLQACVQTIESSVENGKLKEEIVASVANDSVAMHRTDQLEPIIISDSSGETQYPLGMQAMLGIRSWFGDVFLNGSASRSTEYINKTINPGDNIVVNLTVGISEGETFFDNDIVQAFYWNYYEYKSGIDMLMNDLAVSMTVSFRSLFGEHVPGWSLSEQSFVSVQWGFIVVPLTAVVSTAIFLLFVIWRTWKAKARLWKSSILATLVHGLDDATREELAGLDGLPLQRDQAKRLVVKLWMDESDGKKGLLSSRS